MEKQATAKAMNAVFTSQVPKERYLDDDGFLHITLRVMRTGLLKYAPSTETFPDGVPPDAVGSDGMITVLVEPEELGDPDSLASLEGKDILREHVWATPDKPRDAIGSIAGIARFDGEFVVCDAVIKDADAINKLQSGEWSEDSAAYQHVIQWEQEPYVGKDYAGKQKSLRFNHVVMLPDGEGRAGPTVRVINSKEKEVAEEKEYVPFYSRWFKKKVYARNERDAEEMMEEEAKAENESTDGNEGQREATAAEAPSTEEIQKATETIAALSAKVEELTAQLEEARAAISGEAVAEAAEEIAEEREEVAEVMNSAGVMDKAQAMNALKEKKLFGAASKVFAMNSIREKKGRDPIPEEQASNAVAVNAMWNVVKDTVATSTVVGAIPMHKAQAMNSREDRKKNHLAMLGYKTEGAK